MSETKETQEVPQTIKNLMEILNLIDKVNFQDDVDVNSSLNYLNATYTITKNV